MVIRLGQWFKNGDHPRDYAEDRQGLEDGQLRTFTGEYCRAQQWEGAVVRYFRHPGFPSSALCPHCSVRLHDHGWIDSGEAGRVVCPGDWLFTGKDGGCYPCRPDFNSGVLS